MIAPAAAVPENIRRRQAVGKWLLVLCGMVFTMVVLGGLTRLTHSGLSMVEWKPVTGWLPPLSQAEWEEAFAGYQKTPEFRLINVDMTLEGFKSIFWLEFIHRLWGRLIGVVFGVPFVLFLIRGWVDRPIALRLALIFLLGGLQGGMGWFMVKSGMVDRPDVSQYRLTAHLGLALLVYGAMLWVALDLLRPPPGSARPSSASPPPLLRPFTWVVVGCTGVTILSGGFVAGLDAGLIYNTFPLMDGVLIPPGVFVYEPAYLAPFEDVTTVQFDHRMLAISTLCLVLILAAFGVRRHPAPRGRLAAALLGGMAIVQVGLGILTLLLVVPTPLASAHQAGAVVLFSLALWNTFEARNP